MKRCMVILVAGVLVFAMQANATIINVPADYPTIQEAVNASDAGDTVLVEQGTYVENVNLYDKNILLASNFITSNDPLDIDNTIVDGSSSGSVLTYESYQDQDSVFYVSGLTVQNGSCGINVSYGNPSLSHLKIKNTGSALCGHLNDTLRVIGCEIKDNDDGVNVIFYRYVEIDSCLFENNSGAGIYIDAYDALWGRVDHSDFINNGGYGIHIYSFSDVPGIIVDECLFEGNGTALWGGVSVSNSEIRNGENGLGGTYGPWSGQDYSASNCIFENLSGWVFRYPYNHPYNVISDCIIRNNGGEVLTGGVAEEGINFKFENCEFTGNEGDIALDGWIAFTMSNCLFTYNSGSVKCSWDYGGINITGNTFADNNVGVLELTSLGTGSAHIENNIIAGNTGIGLSFSGYNESIHEISCNDVFCNDGGNYEGMPDITGIDGNISIDPRFCDPENGDYHLAENSPCAPDNNDCGELIGALPVNCDAITHTWHVSVDGDDFSGDGSESNPFRTIQHGINMAVDGDTVLVWPGTYTGEGNKLISFQGKNLIVQGVSGAESTILDIEGYSSGFNLQFSHEDSTAAIIGLTIMNSEYGIRLSYSTPKLINLIFENCNTGLEIYTQPPYIDNCKFYNNIIGIENNVYFQYWLRLTNCQFVGNQTGIYTPFMWGYDFGHCDIDSSVFRDNSTAIRIDGTISNSLISGGSNGIYCAWPPEIVATSCIFENITGVVFNAGIPPGGKYWPKPDYDAIVTDFFGPGIAVYNSIVRDNPGEIATAYGLDSDQKNLFFEDCQFYGNGGGIRGQGGLTMIACTYTNNPKGIYFRPFRDIEISSCTFTGVGGDVLTFHGFEFGNLNISGTVVTNGAGHGLIIDNPMNYLEITIDGCTIANNDSDGICLRNDYYDRIIYINTANSIVAHNERSGLWIDDTIDSIGVFYCDNYGNGAGNYFGLPDQTGQNGNISEDPLFIDPDNGNYHLQCASPCVDTGDPELFDPDSTRSDMGAFYLPHYYSPTETGIIAPPNGSVADSLTWLTWLESTDEDTSCNTVFYRLQIDEDPNFESPEVNVDTLPASGFLLEETISYRILSLPGWLNLLADSTYFWRVGSVDEIGDTSAWTPGPNYFIFVIPAQIPTLSEWGMMIMGLLLLVAGTIAVIRRRKAAFRNHGV